MQCTVEPPNKGHFGTEAFALYWGLSSHGRLLNTTMMLFCAKLSVLCSEVVLSWEGPLSEVSLYMYICVPPYIVCIRVPLHVYNDVVYSMYMYMLLCTISRYM